MHAIVKKKGECPYGTPWMYVVLDISVCQIGMQVLWDLGWYAAVVGHRRCGVWDVGRRGSRMWHVDVDIMACTCGMWALVCKYVHFGMWEVHILGSIALWSC